MKILAGNVWDIISGVDHFYESVIKHNHGFLFVIFSLKCVFILFVFLRKCLFMRALVELRGRRFLINGNSTSG